MKDQIDQGTETGFLKKLLFEHCHVSWTGCELSIIIMNVVYGSRDTYTINEQRSFIPCARPISI